MFFCIYGQKNKHIGHFLKKRLMQVKCISQIDSSYFLYVSQRWQQRASKRQDHRAERRRICVTWPLGSWLRRHFGEVDKVPRCFCLGKIKCLCVLDVFRDVFHNIFFATWPVQYALIRNKIFEKVSKRHKATNRKRPSLFCR